MSARLCPVCHRDGDNDCIGVDSLPLPTEHGERNEVTPLFDELQSRVTAVAS